MPFINGLLVNANGRADVLQNGAAGPAQCGGNRYDSTAKLNILSTGPVAPLARNAGFTYDANGQLLITTLGGVGVNYHNGLKFTDAGLLYCDPVTPIVSWVHGWPVGIGGELCIN